MVKTLSEHDIIHGLKNDDRQAHTYIFREHYNALCYFAQALIGNKEEAEDIVLLSYAKFYTLKVNFNSLINIKAFLYITTKNACLDYLRSMKVQNQRLKQFIYLAQENDETAFDNLKAKAELLRMIHKEVEKLPEKYRMVVQLTFFDELTFEDVAARLNISEVNVRKIKSRAVKMLKMRFLSKGLLSLYLLMQRHF